MPFDFSATINPNGSQAIYQQLIDIIGHQVEDGRMKAGEMLPSENELCDSYHISRTTVRQALRKLEIQGMIERKRGLGTFISEPKLSRQLGNLYSFTTDMKSKGLNPSSKIISYQVVNKNDIPYPVQSFCGDRLVYVVRLRLANDIPLLLERTYLSMDLCADLSWERLEKDPLYSILRDHYRLYPCRAIESYEATTLTEKEAEALKCDAGQPSFFIKRSTWDQNDRLIEYTTSVMPGNRSKFEICMLHDEVEIVRRPFKGDSYKEK